jgi:predicted MFS family arabinose efflux permease
VIGAAILAAALAAFAWALSRIGPSEAEAGAADPGPSAMTIVIVCGLGGAGLAAYAFWERRSAHPMTPPRLAENRAFFGLNLATLLIYSGLSIMFFLLPFEIVDRRGLSPAEAGIAFLPFTLGVGLLSQAFGALADKTGARTLVFAGPVGASLAYVWMALGREASLWVGIVGPMALLGVSFAVLIAPLTASVMSSVEESDEGLASGINNTASRIAQLAGVALSAGIASFAFGYAIGLFVAAAASLGGALVAMATLPPGAVKPQASRPA